MVLCSGCTKAVLSCLYFAKKETETKYWSPDCLHDLTASLLAGPLGHPTSLSKAVLSHENTWLSGFYLATQTQLMLFREKSPGKIALHIPQQ